MQIIKSIISYDLLESHKFFKIDGKRYHVDFYLELGGKRLVIERNGEQHYRPVNFVGHNQSVEKTQILFEKQLIRDKKLEEFCKNNDIMFFVVPYWWSEEECINSLKGLNNGWTSTSSSI